MKHYGSTVLSELPQESVIKVLVASLMKLAKLYQIKDFDTETAVLNAHWITQNYKYEQLETILSSLNNPSKTESNIWRITPDVLESWVTASILRQAEKREKEIHNQKFIETEAEGEADPRLTEWLKELESKEGIRPISKEDVKYEGGEKPKKPNYVPPPPEYVIMADLRVKYANECTDLHTGKVNPGMPSFNEWILTQK